MKHDSSEHVTVIYPRAPLKATLSPRTEVLAALLVRGATSAPKGLSSSLHWKSVKDPLESYSEGTIHNNYWHWLCSSHWTLAFPLITKIITDVGYYEPCGASPNPFGGRENNSPIRELLA